MLNNICKVNAELVGKKCSLDFKKPLFSSEPLAIIVLALTILFMKRYGLVLLFKDPTLLMLRVFDAMLIELCTPTILC